MSAAKAGASALKVWTTTAGERDSDRLILLSELVKQLAKVENLDMAVAVQRVVSELSARCPALELFTATLVPASRPRYAARWEPPKGKGRDGEEWKDTAPPAPGYRIETTYSEAPKAAGLGSGSWSAEFRGRPVGRTVRRLKWIGEGPEPVTVVTEANRLGQWREAVLKRLVTNPDDPFGIPLDLRRLAVRALVSDEVLSGYEAILRRMENAGLWPRRQAEKGRKAAPWTDAEREAAFELRTRYLVPDDLLQVRVGVTRQALDLAIGGATAPLTNRWPKSWKPSPELLHRCGLPAPSVTLQEFCKPAPEVARKAA